MFTIRLLAMAFPKHIGPAIPERVDSAQPPSAAAQALLIVVEDVVVNTKGYPFTHYEREQKNSKKLSHFLSPFYFGCKNPAVGIVKARA